MTYRTSLNLPLDPRWLTALLAFVVAFATSGCGDDGTNQDPANDTGVDASPSYDLTIDGLSAPVSVKFDKWGLPHLKCQNSMDCFRAQGYIHASDRFFQMEFIRRSTLGEVSEMIGNLALDLDKPMRRMMTTRQGKPLEDAYYQKLDAETQSMLQAYAAGVNAWLRDRRNEENGAKFSEELTNPLIQFDETRNWEPQDSIALYLQLAFQLGQSADSDLSRGNAISNLGEQVATDLFTVKPGVESNILGAAGASPMSAPLGPRNPSADDMRSIIERLSGSRQVIQDAHQQMDSMGLIGLGPRNDSLGSNSWAVAPSQTKNGDALFANDPHLTLNNPAIWYGMELESTDGLHVVGGSIPAAPGVIFGHNEHVAWGATTARFDLADAYTETLTSNGDAVMRDGEPVQLITEDYTFDFPIGDSRTFTFEWVPNHGPIVSKNTNNNTAISIKWAAHEPGPDLEFLQDLMRAKSVDEAMTAVEPAGAINQNWTFMDAEGNIGWNPMGDVPDRTPWVDADTPNWLPLPADGSAEWQGTLSPDQLPEMKNPPAGYLATANNDMDGSYTDGNATNDGHSPWQHPPALGYRHKRIVNELEAKSGQHTAETMHALQSDTYSLHAATILPRIIDVIDPMSGDLSSDAQAVVSTLKEWNYTCPTGLDGLDPEDASASSDSDVVAEAAGCSAFHVMLPRLTAAIFDDELPGINAAKNWDSFQAPLIYVLTDPSELIQGEAYFDDTDTDGTQETLGDLLPGVMEDTATELNEAFESSDSSDWLWGRIHTLTLESFFEQAGVSTYNYGTFASDGAFYTVDVANPNARNSNSATSYGHNVGASIRLIVRGSSDNGMQGWFQLPGGQAHHRDSQWYNSLLDEWLNDTRHPLLFDEGELEGNVAKSWRVGPK